MSHVPCKRNGRTIALLAALVALSGGVHAQAPPAERSLTLPSGATLKVATDWTVTESKDGLTLEDPEKQLKVEVVEVDASAGMNATISAAWSRRIPGFNRQELASSDSPGREGWDLFHWAEYKTSPEESRRVWAFAARKDSQGVVILVDGSLAAAQRRSSQIALVYDSLRPAGYVRETYVGRTPRPLDAARVEYLKKFIDQMRQAADVPGVSVVLFDKDTTLIEEGFGVRERGRPEPVTANSLYIIASNTKALTTLASLVRCDGIRVLEVRGVLIPVRTARRRGPPPVRAQDLQRHVALVLEVLS